ncbi:MAG: SGNH/GDSL hydrolase family protein [Deltaproteobacteria bacterium]|nr:SGNH/GDSL hydrolase family protein [Deltaproteobacteria bacterium]
MNQRTNGGMTRWQRLGLVVAVMMLGAALMAADCDKPEIKVLTLGDSWAAGWDTALEKELREEGHKATLWNKGIPGSTAAAWTNDAVLFDTLATLVGNLDIKYVMISLGGNDVLQNYKVNGVGDAIFPQVNASLHNVINDILSVRPGINIYLNGYDFLNFEQTTECILIGEEVLGGNTDYKNHVIARLQDEIAAVAADYPNVYNRNNMGVMQADAGIPFAPVYALPTPTSHMGSGDCIHPNEKGYRAIHDAIYDVFFGPLSADQAIEEFFEQAS